MNATIIDENSGNPFPSQISINRGNVLNIYAASTEGYYHNDALIKETATKLTGLVGLAPGKKAMDVGYGSNTSVAEALDAQGIDTYGLDSQIGRDMEKYKSPFFVPPYFVAKEGNMKKYCGTIEELLHPESELRDEKFDLFLFWGSWDSGGQNFAISGEINWFRVIEEYNLKDTVYPPGGPLPSKEGTKLVYEKMQENRKKILKNCRNALNPCGGILVVSSRYARHGEGYVTSQLPWEKRINLQLVQNFVDLGAEELYLIGLSKNAVQIQLEPYPEFSDIAKALSDDSYLFDLPLEDGETNYSPELVEAIKERKVPLGRIDAVYGRFPAKPNKISDKLRGMFSLDRLFG